MPNATPSSVAAFADTAPAEIPPSAGQGRPRLWQTLRQDRALKGALFVLGAIIIGALLAPWLAPYDPTQQFDLALRLQPPSTQYWFGTDLVARDVFSRVLYGARVSLAISFLAVALTLFIGTTFGAVAGYTGGVVDSVMMRTIDALLSIPRLLMLLGVLSLWGQLSPLPLVVLIGVTGWFGVARLVRTQVVALRDRDFVVASRALGSLGTRTLVRHVIPHLASPVLVAATLGVGSVIVVEAGLSFLGSGIPQPQASWGSIIRDGREVIQTAWWLTVFPGLALVLTVLAVNVVSDRLRAAMNPRQLPVS